MTTPWYEAMTAADRSFLVFEGRDTHMHVGGTTVFEGGSLVRADGGVDIERVRAYVESRLPRIPRYRQRLAWVPFERLPVWVDDDRFSIRYHVRHAALPRPGGVRELKRLVGQIMSQQLDRRRPLWELWVVEGLEEQRFGLVLKTHHCVVDGISGVDLMSVLLRTDPDETFEAPEPWRPRPAPSSLELLGDAVERQAGKLARVLRETANLLRDAQAARQRVVDSASHLWEFLRAGLRLPDPTPINGPIGPFRRCDWTSLDLAEVKQVKNRLGCTVNDVILATVAGAMRRYFLRHGADVATLDFRVVVPVNMRTPEEAGMLGNRVSAWLCSLPLGEPSPLRRARRIAATTARLKATRQADGVEALARIAEVFDPIVTLGVRLASALHPYNLIVSNVPGPQFPLYLLGSRLLEGYPFVPLFEQQALGIATFSYDGRLFWGLDACWDAIADLHDIVGDLEQAFQELRVAARGRERRARARLRAAS